MPGDAIIEVQNLSKAYRIWESSSARLKSPLVETIAGAFPRDSAPRRALQRRASRGYREFHALREISFTVRRGESWGIIGRNGSGKSTLLQMIAGTLQPTTGSVRVRGRVAALLELGSGFNPDFTGRENVYLNGSIFGFSEKEMDARFDGIAEFADIGDFIDQPVSTYSSGMMVRLAFSVAICSTPDVLIVDEALSVGDVFFQQKCFKRIHEILESGTSLLFVSHDTAAVQNLCDHAILLANGETVFVGPPEEAASRYFSLDAQKALSVPAAVATPLERSAKLAATKREILQHNLLAQARSQHGARELEVVAISFENEHGRPDMDVALGATVTFHVVLRAHRAIADPSSGLHLYDRMNNLVFAAGTRQLRLTFAPFVAGEERTVAFRLEMAVQPGLYTFSVGCSEASAEGPNHGFTQHRVEGLGPITVHADKSVTWPFYGIARLPLTIAVNQ